VGYDSKHTLAGSRPWGSGRQRRSQSAFVLGDGAFGMPPAAVKPFGEPIKHPPTVRTERSVSLRAARIDRNDRRGDAEFFSAHPVMQLGVVGPVAEEPVDRQVSNGLHHGGKEIGSIVAGTVTCLQGGDQVSSMMRDNSQLGKTPELLHAPRAGQEVAADVVAFQAGGVNRGLGPRFDQAALVGNAENSRDESVEGPFFRSRSCAF